jgi:DNA polymerase-3 subunit gamma/tau
VSELALYRKYRSADFSEVVGQEAVVTTLTAALESGRTSHAYLFSGPRGVGKTSVARLLARGLNCTGSPKPCGVCEHCQEALVGNLDIIEIDGASNRGIDEIRALRDKIALAPARGSHKVYIIDEVHMLTDQAFNALLKTLEEPPSHAVFILATTEAHKLPETIISRTQHFQFAPISRGDLTNQLKQIAKTEKITVDDDALDFIASLSRGGMRDAISLLDQLASSGEANITVKLVHETVGLGDQEQVAKLRQAITNRQPLVALETLDSLTASGIGAGQVANQLIEQLRDQLESDLKGAEVGPALPDLIRMIEGLLAIGRSSWPEVALEAAIIKLSLGSLAARPVLPAAELSPAVPSVAPLTPVVTTTLPKPAEKKPPVTENSNELWLKTLARIKNHNNSLYALLRSSCGIHIEDDQVVLSCRFNFHRNRIEEPKNRQIIEQSLDQVFGRKIRVVSQLEVTQVAPQPPAEKDDLVASALEILGGEVVYE